RLPLRQRHLDIAAEDRLALFGERRDDGGGEAADARERGDAEEQAHGKQPQARKPAAQVAERQLEGEVQAAASLAARSRTIRPSRISTMRPQRAASSVSWVISTSVVPCARCRSNSSSTISWPVAASRLPV